MSIIRLSNHTIRRGNLILCQGINLELNSGQICHITGANGVGKTTLLMQLAGLLPLNIFDTNEISESTTQNQEKNCLPTRAVYISHQVGINLYLTVKQNVCFLLDLYGITYDDQDLNQALEWVGLDGYEDFNCRQLSAGQVRRVNLARLKLMTPNNSKLWLLDEPFTTLDNEMTSKLQIRLQEFLAEGGAVLMTSHQKVEFVDKFLDLF